MTIVGAGQSLAGGAFVGQLVVWAEHRLGMVAGDWRLGLLFSAWGLSGLVATAMMPRLVARACAARVTLLGLPASPVLGVFTALALSWAAGAALLAGWGVAYMLVVVNSITYRQQVTPQPLMCRANTTGRTLSFGLGYPLGAVLAGAVAEFAGPVGGMLAGTAVLGSAAAYAWVFPLGASPFGWDGLQLVRWDLQCVVYAVRRLSIPVAAPRVDHERTSAPSPVVGRPGCVAASASRPPRRDREFPP